MLKKIAIFVILCLIVLAGAGLYLYHNLDTLVRQAVEAWAPKVTQTDVRLERVQLSPLSGAGSLKGLLIGNPKGYASDFAVRVGSARVVLDLKSLATDRIHVREIVVVGPEITLEGGLKDNNLTRIQKNVESFAPSKPEAPAPKSAEPAPKGPEKKVLIDRVSLRDGQVHLKLDFLKGQVMHVPLPNLELKDIGKKSGGATASEAFGQVLGAVTSSALSSAGKASQLFESGAKALEQAAGKLGKDVQKEAGKLLQGLFKKR